MSVQTDLEDARLRYSLRMLEIGRSPAPREETRLMIMEEIERYAAQVRQIESRVPKKPRASKKSPNAY